jgi:hypothetical protein
MFEGLFDWYWRGCAMSEFLSGVHSGMAALLAPDCDPAEVEDFIQRARFRDECAIWARTGLLTLAPLACMAISCLFLAGLMRLSGWLVAVEFALLGLWTLWGHPFLALQVRLWRVAAQGRDTARLVSRFQPYRVAQAAETVQQTIHAYANEP